MSRPLQRLKLKSKDGKKLPGLNRDGSSFEAKQVEFLTIWKNDRNSFGNTASLAPGFTIQFQGRPIHDVYINVFDVSPPEESEDDFGDDEDDDDEDIPF